MEEKTSTFESLVASLSQEETKDLLDKIRLSMQNMQDKCAASFDGEEDKETPFVLQVELSKESFFLRIWLKIISLINSIPVESLYQKELIRRVGRFLKDSAVEYVDVSQQLYTSSFHDMLLKLKKTRAFFSSVLDCYNAEKNSFYMLLLSSISPTLYENLMKVATCFDSDVQDVSSARKNALLKEIERLTSELDVSLKTEMYKTSQAVEWMRTFCDFSLDKVILKFSVHANETTCSFFAIQNEVELLSSILASSKSIPVPMLQTLFLLQKKDEIPLAKSNVLPSNSPIVEDSAAKFIEEALLSLSYIDEFKIKVPLKKIVRYVKQDITWTPIDFRAGEDWFLYFRHAWKDFFLQRWTDWTVDIQKKNINLQMLEVVGEKELEVLKYKPWKVLLGANSLKNENVIEFFKTFFMTTYVRNISPCLKIIISEGVFYRNDVLSEFTSAYASLSRGAEEIREFEQELSPDSVICNSFSSIVANGVLTIKTKAQLESLIRNIEGDIKRIITRVLESLKTVNSILSSIIGGEQVTVHATLTNWSSIQGSSNKKFQEEVENINKTIGTVVDIVSQIISLS